MHVTAKRITRNAENYRDLRKEKLDERSTRKRINCAPFDKVQTEIEIRPNFRSSRSDFFSLYGPLHDDRYQTRQPDSEQAYALSVCTSCIKLAYDRMLRLASCSQKARVYNLRVFLFINLPGNVLDRWECQLCHRSFSDFLRAGEYIIRVR